MEKYGSNSSSERRSLYLDYHATTPCAPEVIQAMEPFLDRAFGNASSAHARGQEASHAVSDSREAVANAIGADPGEVAFTSGTTESNALAVTGSALFAAEKGQPRRRILVSAVEHKSILNQQKLLTSQGFEFETIDVDRHGVISLQALSEALDGATWLVSVQAVNNVIGTVQPIEEIADLAHRCGAYVHADAAQALGKMSVDVREWGVDMASFSSHKIYGPKGVGALYVRGGVRRAPICPLLAGGGQENGLRAGTVNVPGVVGFGVACDLVMSNASQDLRNFREIQEVFEDHLTERTELPISVLGSRAPRVPTCSAVWFHGVEADALAARLPGLEFSTGSACESGALEPSHVFTALGLERTEADQCIRLSFGRSTSVQDVQEAATALRREARLVCEVIS